MLFEASYFRGRPFDFWEGGGGRGGGGIGDFKEEKTLQGNT